MIQFLDINSSGHRCFFPSEVFTLADTEFQSAAFLTQFGWGDGGDYRGGMHAKRALWYFYE